MSMTPEQQLTTETEIADLERRRDARPAHEHSDPGSEAGRLTLRILEKSTALQQATAPPPAPVKSAAEIAAEVKAQQEQAGVRAYLQAELARHTAGSVGHAAALSQYEAWLAATAPPPAERGEFSWSDYHAALWGGRHSGAPVAPALGRTVELMGQTAGWLPQESVEIAGALAEVQASVAGRVVEITKAGNTTTAPMTLADLDPLPKLSETDRGHLHRAVDALPEDQVLRFAQMGAGKSPAVQRALVRIGRRMLGK